MKRVMLQTWAQAYTKLQLDAGQVYSRYQRRSSQSRASAPSSICRARRAPRVPMLSRWAECKEQHKRHPRGSAAPAKALFTRTSQVRRPAPARPGALVRSGPYFSREGQENLTTIPPPPPRAPCRNPTPVLFRAMEGPARTGSFTTARSDAYIRRGEALQERAGGRLSGWAHKQEASSKASSKGIGQGEGRRPSGIGRGAVAEGRSGILRAHQAISPGPRAFPKRFDGRPALKASWASLSGFRAPMVLIPGTNRQLSGIRLGMNLRRYYSVSAGRKLALSPVRTGHHAWRSRSVVTSPSSWSLGARP